jgi:hypothetical protein
VVRAGVARTGAFVCASSGCAKKQPNKRAGSIFSCGRAPPVLQDAAANTDIRFMRAIRFYLRHQQDDAKRTLSEIVLPNETQKASPKVTLSKTSWNSYKKWFDLDRNHRRR